MTRLPEVDILLLPSVGYTDLCLDLLGDAFKVQLMSTSIFRII